MIRREIAFPDEAKLWLMISQVDHAQVSGELTRNWSEEFSQEVVVAITHHDDGWAAWETDPKLNTETGVPYSFLEMPLDDALTIWDDSIEAARKFGLLAGWIVAGHFYNLLSDSENARQPHAIAWLTAKRKVRTAWVDQWLRDDPKHSLEDAKRAQQMLLVADLFSLWLCCDCPVEGNRESILAQSNMKLRTDRFLGRFRFAVRECLVGRSAAGNRVTGLVWTVAVDPYPIKEPVLSLSVKSVAAPVSRYAQWEEIVAASWPVELRWRLVPQ